MAWKASCTIAGVLAIAAAHGQTSVRDTRSDAWNATDGLGRRLPIRPEVPPPRKDRYVGVFYFLWLGEHGTDGPFDISKILARDPAARNDPSHPSWGPLGAPHHWGEPRFGYYVSTDDWVLRRHAQMLADAGVDTVIFDVTNQLTYPRAYQALCRVWSKVRVEGGRTPGIAFLTPFGDPSAVVRTLFEELYEPGLYRDLWFRWEGRPLILANPAAINPESLGRSLREPGLLRRGETYGQSFVAERPFTAVGGEFPTYHSADSAVTLSLYAEQPGGRLLGRRRIAGLKDNALAMLELDATLPPGRYYLEQSEPQGQVGWWSQRPGGYREGKAYATASPSAADRSLSVRFEGDSTPTAVVRQGSGLPEGEAAALERRVRGFFTFRAPQPDYFSGPTGPEQWAWLEVSPQHAFPAKDGSPEQVAVGVAQNALEGKLSALSHPTSLGRSYHTGVQSPWQEDFLGRNFQEQWDRALALDPRFVFVTGWNEWVAGRFAGDAPFHGAGPVTFVDTFDREHSRDIEPMMGGHGDAYYYQLVANVRRFKGARQSIPAPGPRSVVVDGRFNDWTTVAPEYLDDLFDAQNREHPGWGHAGQYRDRSARNDLARFKVAADRRQIGFYAEARERWREVDGGIPLTLWIETPKGEHYRLRYFGRASHRAGLERRTPKGWSPVGSVPARINGNRLELLVPVASLGLVPKDAGFDFQWTDNVDVVADPTAAYVHGDSAPNGRFRYRFVQNNGGLAKSP